jgi:hypothetical protein
LVEISEESGAGEEEEGENEAKEREGKERRKIRLRGEAHSS